MSSQTVVDVVISGTTATVVDSRVDGITTVAGAPPITNVSGQIPDLGVTTSYLAGQGEILSLINDIANLRANVIITGQTLTDEIGVLSGVLISTGNYLESNILTLSGNLIASGNNLDSLRDILSGNLITTGQTLQAQITSNDSDIASLVTNLITTGQTLQTQITSNDGDIATLTSNLVTTGQTLTTDINTVSANLISTGKVADDISGNLNTTGQTLQTQITSNDGDITTLTSDLSTLTSNVVTTGQTLQTQITSNDSDIATLDSTTVKLTTNQSIAGNKIFSDRVTINNLHVTGTEVIVDVENLAVKDNLIHINSGESGAGISRISGGVTIDRGTEPDANILYNDANDRFELNFPLALEGNLAVTANQTGVYASAANLVTTGQTLQTQITSNDGDISTLTINLATTGATLTSEVGIVSGLITDNDGDITALKTATGVLKTSTDTNTSNLISTGNFLDSEIAIVSGLAGGAVIDALSGDLITTGQTLQVQITSNDNDISTLTSNLVATGQTLTTEKFDKTGGTLVGSVFPNITESLDLGSSGKKWRNLWVKDAHVNSGTLFLGEAGANIKVVDNRIQMEGDSTEKGPQFKGDVLITDGTLSIGGNLAVTANQTGVLATAANLITTGRNLEAQITSNDSDISTLTTNLISTGKVVDDISGNLITTGQHLTDEIAIVSGIAGGGGSDPALSGKVDTLSGNLITTGQTLQTQITSNDGDISTLTTNLITTGQTLTSEIAIVSGIAGGQDFDTLSGNLITTGQTLTTDINAVSSNLITTGQTLQTQITSNDTDISNLTSNVITTGQTLTSEIAIVSGIAESHTDVTALSGKVDDISGNLIITGQTLQTQITSNDGDITTLTSNLITTGQTLQTQITSNDSDISTLTSNLITTGQALTTDINTVSTNLISTGAVVDDISGNLITTGQTLTTNINTVSTNLITTGQTLQTQVTSNDGDITNLTSNLITTGQTLTSEIGTVSGLITDNDAEITALLAATGELKTDTNTNASNLVTTGQTLTSEIAIVSGIAEAHTDVSALSGKVDDISGNLITTGQTLQTQITSNDTDISNLTANLISTGSIVDDISGNLITTGQTLQTQITSNDGDITNLTSNLITTGQTLTTEITTVSGLITDNDDDITALKAATGVLKTSTDDNTANLISTGAIVDDISGNLITSGQTLQTQITSNDSDISTLTTNVITTGQTLTTDINTVSTNLVSTGSVVDDISGNLITTGQTLQTQITSNDGDITSLTSNLITTGQTLQTQITSNDADIATLDSTTVKLTTNQSVAGNKIFTDTVTINNLTVTGTEVIVDVENLAVKDNIIHINSGESGAGISRISGGITIDRGTEPSANILYNDANDRFELNFPLATEGNVVASAANLITTGQTLTTSINTVSTNLVSTGSVVDDISGNLITTGQTLQTQITSNDGDISTLTSNLVTTGQTLTTNINTVSTNLVSTGAIVDDVSGNLITTGQTLQTQITSNDTDITNLSSNLVTTGQTLTTNIDTVATNLVTTGQTLTSEINTVSGLIPPTVVDGAGVTGYTARWFDGNTLTTGALYDNGTRIGIGTNTPDYTLDIVGTVGIDNYIYHNGDDDTYLKFEGNEVNLVAGGKSMIKLDYNNNANDKVQINNTNADIDVQVMADDGEVILHTDAGTNRVGIGTTTPGSLLEVYQGDVSIVSSIIGGTATPTDGILKFSRTFDNSGVATANKIVLYEDGANPGWKAGIGISSNDVDFFSGENFRFWTGHGTSTEGNNRLTILTDGKVGIGTNAPSKLLDVNGTSYFRNNIYLVDGAKAVFGAGDDLQIYHDGTNSYIDNASTYLILESDNIILRNNAGTEDYAKFLGDGAVNLYYNNALKLETNSGGVTVTGTAILGGASFVDNATAYFGTGNDLRILHDGTDSFIKDAGQGNLKLLTDEFRLRNAADSAHMLTSSQGGAVTIYHNGAQKLITTSTGVTVTGGVTATAANGFTAGTAFFYSASSIDRFGGNAATTRLYANGAQVLELTSTGLAVTGNATFADNGKAIFGGGNDLQIYHDGSNSYIKSEGVGDLYIQQGVNDKDIKFQCDDGSGGLATYFALDGSDGYSKAHKKIRFLDQAEATFGNADDLRIYHDGSNSHIKNTGSLYVASETSGDLYLRSDDDIFIQPQGGENGITLTGDGAVTLYHDNAVKLATTSTGVTVTGALKTTTILDTNNSAGTNGQVLVSTGAALDWKTLSEISGVDGTGTANYLSKWTDTDTIGNSSIFDNDSQVTIDVPVGIVAGSGSGTLTGRLQIGSTTSSANNSLVFWRGAKPTLAANQGAILYESSGMSDGEGMTFMSDKGYKFLDDAGTTEWVRIISDGNVGIGTTAPSADLEVSTASGGEFLVTRSGNSGVTLQQVNGGDATSGSLSIKAGTAMTLYTNGTGRALTIDSSQKVGIGTDTPGSYDSRAERLVVHESGDGGVTIATGATSDGRLVFARSGDTGLDHGEISYDQNTDYMGFATAGSRRVTLDNSGKVGIGTDAPLELLHVQGTNDASDVSIRIKNLGTSNGTRTDLDFHYSTADRIGGRISCYLDDTSTNSTSMHFLTRVNNSSGERMRIDSAGNVGIGTTAPSAKLHVDVGASGGAIIEGDDWSRLQLAITGSTIGILNDDTINAFSIYDWTSSAYRMVVNTSGKVGIGTTAPSDLLHLDSSGHTEMSLDRGSTSYDATLKYRTAGTADWQIGTGLTGTDAKLTWYSSAAKMTLTTDGKLGIGTATPAAVLDIRGDDSTSAGSGLIIGQDASTDGGTTLVPNAWLKFYLNSIRNGAMIKAGRDNTYGSASHADGNLQFHTALDDTLAEHMRITSAGSVGIGVTAPGQRLSIVGSGTGASTSSFRTQNSNNSKWLDFSDGGYVNLTNLQFNQSEFKPNNTDYTFKLGNLVPMGTLGYRFRDVAGTVLMDILNTGKVGIGTNAPAYKLDVAGDIRVGQGQSTGILHSGGDLQFYADGTKVIEMWTSGSDHIFKSFHDIAYFSESNVKVGLGTTSPEEKLHIAGTEAVIKLVDTAATSAGYVDFDGVALQLTTNRNPNTGAFADTSKSHANISLSGANGGSKILFYTANANNTTGTQRAVIEADGTLDLKSAKFKINGSAGSSGQTLTTDGSGNISWSAAGSGTISGSGTDNYIPRFNGTSALQDSAVYASDAGDLGFGTTSPSSTIHLANGRQIRIDKSGNAGRYTIYDYAGINTAPANDGFSIKLGGDTKFKFINDRLGIGNTSPAKALHIGDAANVTGNGTIRLQGYSAGGSGNYHDIVSYGDNLTFYRNSTMCLFLQYNGNVGIGTTAPGYTLHGYLSGSGTVAKFQTNGRESNILIQNDAQTWKIVNYDYGNNGTDHLGFHDGTADRLVIGNNGKVGIGTTAPEYPLHISSADSAIYLVGSDQGRIILQDTGATSNSQAFDIVSKEDKLHFRRLNNGRDSVQATVMALSGDKVGIGTDAPLAKLHVREAYAGSFTYDGAADTLIVESNANGGITIATAAANTGRIIFASPNDPTGAEIKYSDATSLMTIGNTNPGDSLAFQSGNGVEAMRIKSDGNVGIGTVAPSSLLEIGASVNTTDQLQINGPSSTTKLHLGQFSNASYIFSNFRYRAAQTADSSSLGSVGIILQSDSTSGTIAFQRATPSATPARVTSMLIANDGKVGIGVIPATDWDSAHEAIQLGLTASLFSGGAATGWTQLMKNGRYVGGGVYKYITTDEATRYNQKNDGTHHFDVAPSGTANAAITFTTALSILNDGTLDLKSAKFKINGSGGTNGYTIVTDGSGNISWSSAGTGTVTGSGTDNYVPRWNGTTALQNSALFSNDSGSVGIGTDAPDMPLVVKTTAAIQTMKLNGHHTGYGSSLQFDATDAGGLNFELVSGGSGTGGSMNSKFSIRDVANNAPRLTIDSVGNVGIGIATPSERLHIAESTSGSASIRITNSTTGTGSSSGLRVSLEADENTTIMNHSNTNLNLGVNGLNVISIKDAKVGIGTTAPGRLLHLYTSAHTYARIQSSATNKNAAVEYYDGTNWMYAGLLANEGGGTGNWAVITGTGSKVGLSVKQDGNVGIGTNAPVSLLHVQKFDSGNYTGEVRVGGSNTDHGILTSYTQLSATEGSIHVAPGYANSSALFKLRCSTNNTNQLVLKGDGKVGIGTDAPAYLFHVKGAAADIVVQSTTGTNRTGYQAANTGGASYFYRESSSGGGAITGSAAYATVVGASAGAYPLQLGTNNAVRLTIDSAGKVGIGTATPAWDLTLYKSGGTLGVVGAGSPRIDVMNTAGSKGLRIEKSADAYSTLTNYDGGAGASLTLQGASAGGNVGIGTATPNTKLVIVGSGGTDVLNLHKGTGVGGIKFTFNGTNYVSYIRTYEAGATADNYMAIGVSSGNNTTGVEVMRLKGDGNVGIGTTTPAAKLDVNGDVRIGNSTRGHYLGEKALTVNGTTYTTALTIVLSDHNAAHVKLFLTGDWSGHSAVAYVGEYFIQNGAGGYAEPGMIISEFDNTHTDFIESKIVDPSTDTFTIQLKLSDSDNGSLGGHICYHVMGEVTSVT